MITRSYIHHRAVPALLLSVALWVAGALPSHAQSVGVIARLDTNSISVGGSTVLHILAQVLPAYRATSDRIFSWYVDVLNTNGPAATAQYGSMTKPTSDNDPQTSSSGFNDGANRRGVYDTFINRPGAGVTNLVELMTIPITGVAGGRTRFRVQAGTGVPSLSEDFIVAPTGGGEPYTNGDYSAAFVDLTVLGDNCNPRLAISYLDGTGPATRWTLSFTPCAGYSNIVESVDELVSGANWQPLPGAPHNSGSVTITNSVAKRFYRIRAAR